MFMFEFRSSKIGDGEQENENSSFLQESRGRVLIKWHRSSHQIEFFSLTIFSPRLIDWLTVGCEMPSLSKSTKVLRLGSRAAMSLNIKMPVSYLLELSSHNAMRTCILRRRVRAVAKKRRGQVSSRARM